MINPTAAAIPPRVMMLIVNPTAEMHAIVEASVADEFERRMVAGMAALRVGDPMDETTEVGPLATPGILDALDAQVRRSVELGARSVVSRAQI